MNRWLLLVGALQGWALWALWKARELKAWPSDDPLSERTLLYVSLALPLAFYLTQDIRALARSARVRILAGIGILFAMLGAYSGWAENVAIDPLRGIWSHPPTRPSDLFGAALFGFIAIPLVAHFEYGNRRWSYRALFETSWRNALLVASSVSLTGVFWVVLVAGTMLMKSIGIDFFLTLIRKPVFAIPVTGIVFGAAFALGLARVGMILTLRRFWLSMSSWLLPLLLAFSVMWVLALPFTGLESLFKTRNAAFILLWFVALSVNFANAAYQDGAGEQPYGRRLGKMLEYAWLSLLALTAVAWWALLQRIGQYAWTEDRVWGVFVLILATLYTAGYAYSLRLRHGWLANIGKTNIATALMLCGGLLLLLSPLADARRIAVDSQMSRLISGQVAADKIDYAYLRWQAGRYGEEALNQLVAGIAHEEREVIATRAKQTLAQEHRYAPSAGAESLTLDQLRLRLRVLPPGEELDDPLLKLMQQASRWEEKRCLQTDAECVVWMLDLNNDGLKEAIVIKKKAGASGNAHFYRQLAAGGYEYGGTVNFGYSADKKRSEQLMADIEQGKATTVAPVYNDLMIGEQRIGVTPVDCGAGCQAD